MRYLFLLIIQVCAHWLAAQAPLPPIGQWRDHLPYQTVTRVSSFGSTVLAETPYGLFSYDTDDPSIVRYSRVNGLSGSGIRFSSGLPRAGRWLLAYSNNQIDLISASGIETVYDIVNSNQVPANGILSLLEQPNRVLLCTSIGILILDAARAEISDTWRIGTNGASIPVFSVVLHHDSLFAATAEGLKTALAREPNLADFANWVNLSGQNMLPSATTSFVGILNDQLLVQLQDRFFIRKNGQWELLYASDEPVSGASCTAQELLFCVAQGASGSVKRINDAGQIMGELTPPGAQHRLRNAIALNNQIWIADSLHGLWEYENGLFQLIAPSSPAGPALGPLRAYPNLLLAATGTASNKGSWFSWDTQDWTNYTTTSDPPLDSSGIINDVVYNTITSQVFAASQSGGLLHWSGGSTAIVYKQGFLDPPFTIDALYLDKDQQLWMVTPGSSSLLTMRDPAGNWQHFSPPFLAGVSRVHQMTLDQSGHLWLAAGEAGVICYDPGTRPNDASDDRWKQLGFSAGTGSLPGSSARTVAVDKSGLIWVGTNDGIAVLECADRIFDAAGCEAIRPVVQTGSFAGFLFANESILSVTPDPADRKWVGTRSGASLLSPAGDSVLLQFNSSNSPMPGDSVTAIAVMPGTGEVFFSGPGGISSWRATATEPAPAFEKVQIFPNPVPPNYSGQIGIRGLVDNSIVKITELNGRLVFQTRSLGGQATWDGRDYKGRHISSGVYLVFAKVEGQKEKAIGKIIIVNR